VCVFVSLSHTHTQTHPFSALCLSQMATIVLSTCTSSSTSKQAQPALTLLWISGCADNSATPTLSAAEPHTALRRAVSTSMVWKMGFSCKMVSPALNARPAGGEGEKRGTGRQGDRQSSCDFPPSTRMQPRALLQLHATARLSVRRDKKRSLGGLMIQSCWMPRASQLQFSWRP
jgi:hypothetical protein